MQSAEKKNCQFLTFRTFFFFSLSSMKIYHLSQFGRGPPELLFTGIYILMCLQPTRYPRFPEMLNNLRNLQVSFHGAL